MIDITCDQLFDGDVLRGPSRITLNNGIVTSIEPFNGSGKYPLVCPGFVDIQMNGFDKWDVSVCHAEDLRHMDSTLANLGTTTWLATIVTAPINRLNTCLTRLHQLFSSQSVAGFAGIHIEGPFLGQSPGAHNPSWIIPIDIEWLSSLEASVRLVTLAAEQVDAPKAIATLASKNIAASIGHSQPNRLQFDACLAAGAQMVTHLFNGMSGVHHRNDGLALMALTSDDLKAGLIADLVHCSPEAINLAFRAKASNQIILVSDSVAWNSEWAQKRGITIVDGSPRLPDGTLAGSSTPLAQCVANAVLIADVALDDALRAATSTPADIAKIATAGRIRLGEPADLIALDASLSVVHVWRRLPSERA